MMGNYAAYPSYKDSGVEWLGDIPEHWQVKRVKYAFLLQRGDDLSREEMEEGEYPVFGSNGVIGTHTKFTVKAPSITVGRSGSVGEVNYIDKDFWAHNTALYVKQFTDSYPRFIFYLLKTLDIKSLSWGTAVGTLNRNYIHDLINGFPPLDEQRAIAAFLDYKTQKIDQLIAKKEDLLEKLDEKRTALISHAVTKGLDPTVLMKDSGVEWLSKIPEHWEPIRLKFLINTRKGIAFKSTDFLDYGCRVVRASDIKNHTILESNLFLDESFKTDYPQAILTKDEIVISTVGSNPDVKNSAVGQVGIVPHNLDQTLLNQNTVVFSSKDSLNLWNKFLFYLLISTRYRDHLNLYAHGTANQSSLNIFDMLDFCSSFPPLNEQKKIAQHLDQKTTEIDQQKAKIIQAIDLLKEYRTALITNAVTGKIDVRSVPLPTP